jgi:ankyrin repeat protein
MRLFQTIWMSAVFVLAVAAGGNVRCGRAEESKKALPNADIPGLIDRLRDVKDGGVGYMPTRSGSGFLPLGTSEQGAMLLGQQPPASSDALRELVACGPSAIPHLIAHLDDKRATEITIKHEGGFGGMFFEDEYDYNRRTVKRPPAGVNRDSFGGNAPDKHTVTVGDLCFVALGQIVNRHFNAVRYQPTACIMVNSPTHSKSLLNAVRKEWGDQTPAEHEKSLVRDLVLPDSEDRRNGACLRLGYYYRESFEPLVLKQLSQPRYDVFQATAFIREKLYPAGDAEHRKDVFDDFVAKHGEVSREGILVDLFEDLDMQEADEQGRLSPRLEEKYAARECLIQLYGYPKEVKSEDRPRILPITDFMQARFIEVLVFFPSEKIDQAVRHVLQSTNDDYLANACVFYLVGRGADQDIRTYVERQMPGADKDRRRELARILDQQGWTPLHAASERYEPDRVAMLIKQGADINARAANGQTPLHVAASSGSFGAMQVLLEAKAALDLKDHQGRTPMQAGIAFDTAVEILLQAGAEPSDILLAAFAGRADLVEGFLKLDKKLIAATTARGETPLHMAAGRGHVKVAKLLLDNGAEVNARDQSQFTPLHEAAISGSPEMVTLLLDHHADPTAKSWDGKTALIYAQDRRDQEIIRLLETNH